MDSNLQKAVWGRLIAGASLEGLGLSRTDGRIDLRGIGAPKPSEMPQYVSGAGNVTILADLVVLRGVTWRGIDFADARLGSLRFFDSVVDNCRFDRADCEDWRLWGTRVIDTSFRSADLRGSALGGIENRKRNMFQRVDFTKADLRRTVYVSADMIECLFSDTNLSKVDFQGTVFTGCTFRGDLNEVIFYRKAFRGESFPANEMKNVDLREARLHFVAFRGLDMTSVKWPADDEHVILDDYSATLDRLINGLKGRGDVPSKKLTALLAMMRKWAGVSQKQGVVSKADLVEAAGETLFEEVMKQLRRPQ